MTNGIRITTLAVAVAALALVPVQAAAQVTMANVRIHAEIESVDHDNHSFILRGPQGHLMERRVPDDMPGFGARRAGDEVVVTFLHQVGIHLHKPGAPLPNLSEIQAPARVVLIVDTVTGEVSQVDATEQAISFRSTSGPGMEATIRLPAGLSLSDFAVGDLVDVTYVIPDMVSVENR